MRVLVVLSTTPDKKSARKIARVLIQKKLAACVSFVPSLESLYRWKGKIESVSEVLVIAKTSQSKWKALQKAMLEIHPYEVPEILCLSASRGSAGYLRWFGSVLK